MTSSFTGSRPRAGPCIPRKPSASNPLPPLHAEQEKEEVTEDRDKRTSSVHLQDVHEVAAWTCEHAAVSPGEITRSRV
ncbi:hypothetical protein FQN60_005105 [Etheostoma spectabile]|uniref:Uncharacterized protein n=1 Tax=Etheostoma spectabile TaxID=54343 RepID=A0A5J5DLN5_9PERO|nr:hypothetical protein FQN60_005105 [Etheostoma spectabile]